MADLIVQDGQFLEKAVKALIVVAIAVTGATTCAIVGALAYPVGGVGAVVGAISGFVVFGCLSFCISGAWRYAMPKDVQTYGLKALQPEFLQRITNRAPFTIIVTIHEVKDLRVKGLMPWTRPDMYVEITCGLNPPKRSCVRHDGNFNEQFALMVEPLDESILVQIKDQDVFGSTDIGYVAIDIPKDIIREGFPWQASFSIQAWDNDKIAYTDNGDPQLVLSFDHTDDVPSSIARSSNTKSNRSKKMLSVDKSQTNVGRNYGAVNFLAQYEFNTHKKIDEEYAVQVS